MPQMVAKVRDAAGGSKAVRTPWLSVIVPVHNGRLQLSRCLEALGKSEYTDFEVIVVDDSSTDNTRQIVERYRARYVRTPCRMGPGGARNLGVRDAQGEIVVFVDTDVVLPPEALRLIAEQFDRDPELAAVFGSYDEEPAWGNFLSQYKNLMHHFVHQSSNERAVTFWAGCGAMRRDRFEEMGGFAAQKYPEPSIEDIELGLRLVRARGKIRLNKQLQVKHLKRWTLRGLLRADIFYRAVPWTKLILETRNVPRDLNLTYASQVSAALVGLLVVVTGLLPFSAAGLTKWMTPAILVAVLATVGVILLMLNWRVYAFFGRKRGWPFAAVAVLAHWFYYLYSGVVFLLLFAAHFAEAPFGALRAAMRRPRPQE